MISDPRYRAVVLATALAAAGCAFEPTLEPSGDRTAPGCVESSEYVARPGGDGLYRVVDMPMVFDRAQAFCAGAGAHLVAVDDRAENDYVLALIAASSWLGLHDLIREKRYTWVTGAPLGFSAWDDGQPQDSDGEDCMVIQQREAGGNSWHDYPCQDEFPFVCECEPEAAAPPPPACMEQPSYATVTSGRRYRAEAGPVSWPEANASCAADGGHLFAPSDGRENDDVIGAAATDEVWIGLTDAEDEATWRWVNEAPMEYVNWAAGEPDDSGPDADREDCAEADRQAGSTWRAAACDAELGFLCECDPTFAGE